jgi:hypothetical protein
MGTRPNCRSCRHCTPPSGGELGWCQLRELSIHPELANELWCHHWTARPPRLPGLPPGGGRMGAAPVAANHQLSLPSMPGERRGND